MRRVITMTNHDSGFYQWMDPIFGSREIERKIKDRIYDDPGKIWHMLTEDESVLALISVKETVVKNVYAETPELLKDLLKQLPVSATGGVIPAVYREVYQEAGYTVSDHSLNFVKIGVKQDGRENKAADQPVD